MSTDSPWRDAETLRELYWGEGLSQPEIADRLDCGVSTVTKWMGRNDIEVRAEGSDTKWLRDPDNLGEAYHEKEMSITDIAEELDVVPSTVSRWMNKFDIEYRDRGEAISMGRGFGPAYFSTKPNGYEKWDVHDIGGRYTVQVHRLVAIAEYGLDAVVDNHIHHKNEIPWDNRPENLEPMDPSEHLKHHAGKRSGWGKSDE